MQSSGELRREIATSYSTVIPREVWVIQYSRESDD
jgi:hypothetical protein